MKAIYVKLHIRQLPALNPGVITILKKSKIRLWRDARAGGAGD
jgi:hypothetical protein